MRVAHVITRMILGGAQENTLLTCEDLLHEHGDDVLLVTGPALGPEGSLLARANQRGVPVALVDPLRRAIHPWRDAVSYRQIHAVLGDYQPDVVHTHSAKGGILGRAAAWSLGVPVIVHTVHGAPFHPYQTFVARTFFAACERWAARRCHALVSVADAMTDLMVAARVAPREKFTTIYSGMEVEPFLAADTYREAVRKELGYAATDVVIGKVARLFHLKGHDDLLAAAAQVVREVPQARFLLVGDGILRDALMRQVADSGLVEHVRFLGLVPPARIPELMGAMDLVVHTSLREGLARVLPQALLSGRPAISYDIDGAREVVFADETGCLVRPRDVKALAASMVKLAKDPALRTRLGEAGRTRCLERFDHRNMTAAIRELYLCAAAASLDR